MTEEPSTGGVSAAEFIGIPRASATRERPEGPRVCAVCGSAAKYTCPACSAQTCSLPCSKGHKARTGCTGKRNRAAYVPLDEYTESTLASDFGLIEETERAAVAAARSRPPPPKPAQQLPHYLKQLTNQARMRGVQLDIQQPGMAKRTRNSSRWEKTSRGWRLAWRVEWSFPAAGPDITVADPKVEDSQPLRPLLEAHLAPALRGGLAAGHVLRQHAMAGPGALAVLMRRPYTPANVPEYWRVDLDQPLRSQLAGHTVVEFPTLWVLTQEEVAAGGYPLAAPSEPPRHNAAQLATSGPPPPPRPPAPKPPEAAYSAGGSHHSATAHDGLTAYAKPGATTASVSGATAVGEDHAGAIESAPCSGVASMHVPASQSSKPASIEPMRQQLGAQPVSAPAVDPG